MSEMMTFPDNIDEFMEQYKITDTEQVYTNGCELVPIFRMKQWFESHPEPHWIPVTEPPKGDFMPYYATCRSKVDDRENWVIEGMYTKYSGWEYPPMVRDDRAEIIAWMPKELPEPFKGVTT